MHAGIRKDGSLNIPGRLGRQGKGCFRADLHHIPFHGGDLHFHHVSSDEATVLQPHGVGVKLVLVGCAQGGLTELGSLYAACFQLISQGGKVFLLGGGFHRHHADGLHRHIGVHVQPAYACTTDQGDNDQKNRNILHGLYSLLLA